MKLTLTLILSLTVLFVSAQRVGIGISTPTERLHVDSNIRIGVNARSSPLFDRFLKFGDGNYVTIGEAGADDRLEFSAGEFLFKFSGTAYPSLAGKVGININRSPTAFLEVNGDVRITDGTEGDGKILTSSADGTASWKDMPGRNTGFNVSLTAGDITVNDATDKIIVFDNIAMGSRFNDAGGYNSSNGFYTAPVAGVYSFNVKIEWEIAAGTSGTYSVYLDINGTSEDRINQTFTAGAGNETKTISFGSVLKLNAQDVVKVYVRQSTGTDQTVKVTNSSFSGFRLY